MVGGGKDVPKTLKIKIKIKIKIIFLKRTFKFNKKDYKIIPFHSNQINQTFIVTNVRLRNLLCATRKQKQQPLNHSFGL